MHAVYMLHELLHVVTCPMTGVRARPAPALPAVFLSSHGHRHIDISTSSTVTSTSSHRYQHIVDRRIDIVDRRIDIVDRHIDIVTSSSSHSATSRATVFVDLRCVWHDTRRKRMQCMIYQMVMSLTLLCQFTQSAC